MSTFEITERPTHTKRRKPVPIAPITLSLTCTAQAGSDLYLQNLSGPNAVQHFLNHEKITRSGNYCVSTLTTPLPLLRQDVISVCRKQQEHLQKTHAGQATPAKTPTL